MPTTCTIEQMITELQAAGWEPYRRTLWLSPAGRWFRGPFGAWTAMRLEHDDHALDQDPTMGSFDGSAFEEDEP